MADFVQVTPANRNTVDYPGMCARFQWKAFGAQNGWGFGSARDAWFGQANKHPGERPPAGVDVPIWLSWDIDPNWHAAVSLADGSVLTSPVNPNPNTPRQDRFPSIGALIAAFPGQMRYLGWAESMDGTRVVKLKVTKKPSTNRSNEMIGLHGVDGQGRYGPKGVQYWWTYDPANKTVTYLDYEGATALSTTFGTSFGNANYKTWEAFHMQAESFIDATVDPPVRLAGPKGTR